jgi:hypothetical protein
MRFKMTEDCNGKRLKLGDTVEIRIQGKVIGEVEDGEDYFDIKPINPWIEKIEINNLKDEEIEII